MRPCVHTGLLELELDVLTMALTSLCWYWCPYAGVDVVELALASLRWLGVLALALAYLWWYWCPHIYIYVFYT